MRRFFSALGTYMVAGLVGVAVLIALGWLREQVVMTDYCTQSKDIVRVEMMARDGGEYADESYRLHFDDGSVGVMSDGDAQTGRVCLKAERLYPDSARAQHLTKADDYLRQYQPHGN